MAPRQSLQGLGLCMCQGSIVTTHNQVSADNAYSRKLYWKPTCCCGTEDRALARSLRFSFASSGGSAAEHATARTAGPRPTCTAGFSTGTGISRTTAEPSWKLNRACGRRNAAQLYPHEGK